jgi:hypothetical protein
MALLPWWSAAAAAVLVLAAVAAEVEAGGGGEGDGRALMAVKAGFGNAANTLVDWDGGRDHCAWRGVACDSASFAVVGLCVHSAISPPPPCAVSFLAAAWRCSRKSSCSLAVLPAFCCSAWVACGVFLAFRSGASTRWNVCLFFGHCSVFWPIKLYS